MNEMGQAKRNLEELKKAFETNPNDFVDVKECLLIIAKTEDGYRVMNNCQNVIDIYMTLGFAEEALQNRRDQIRYAQMKEKQSTGIIIPGRNGNGQANKVGI